MKTNFSSPSEIDGLTALVKITVHEFMPFVRSGQMIEKVIDRKEVEIPLDGTLLTYDTIMWSGYYLNLEKLATRAASQFSNPISVQLIDVL
jgi:hypothetical protein